MHIPRIHNISPPTNPPKIAVLLLLIIGNRDENTTIMIKELDPIYRKDEDIKFPFPVRPTPSILENLKPSLMFK